MKKKSLLIMGCIAIMVTLMSTSVHAVPYFIAFQGRLTDNVTGEPVNATNFPVQFRIYDGEPDGDLIWGEQQTVNVTDGIYDTLIGSGTPTYYGDLDLVVFQDDNLWLEVELNGEIQAPRTRIVSAPFAMRAALAESVLDGVINSSMIAGGGVSAYNIEDGAVRTKILDEDGHGTGLDADMLDGLHASQLQKRVSGTCDSGSSIRVITEEGTVTCEINDGGGTTDCQSCDGRFVNVDGDHIIGNTTSSLLGITQNSIIGTAISVSSQGTGIYAEGYSPNEAAIQAMGPLALYAWVESLDTDIAAHFRGNIIMEDTKLIANPIVQGVNGFDTSGEEGIVYLGSDSHYIKGVYGEGVKIGTYGVGDVVAIDQLTGRVHISSPVTTWGTLLIESSHPGDNEVTIGFLKGSDAPGSEQWFAGVGAWGETDNFVIGQGGAKLTITPGGHVSVPILEITGGSDLSERFDINSINEDLLPKPGMVVSIDPDNPGDLAISDREYDRRVAGIISGAGGVNPGMLMGQDGSEADGGNPIALTGRVYCWADASNGPIIPGDLLTTSDVAGHAMKVTDYVKAQGAILGKAMSSLDKNKGLVLVLVSLQ